MSKLVCFNKASRIYRNVVGWWFVWRGGWNSRSGFDGWGWSRTGGGNSWWASIWEIFQEFTTKGTLVMGVMKDYPGWKSTGNRTFPHGTRYSHAGTQPSSTDFSRPWGFRNSHFSHSPRASFPPPFTNNKLSPLSKTKTTSQSQPSPFYQKGGSYWKKPGLGRVYQRFILWENLFTSKIYGQQVCNGSTRVMPEWSSMCFNGWSKRLRECG